ncbi:LarC family nickel insertion protein [Oceanobacillus sp. FSL H7-0719]|uniref:LarC family nickel insertion protein n=1 Tax=Oceanobacillus sp. FSL H7-0719 TaxID=2954507 RepID=UPI003246478A
MKTLYFDCFSGISGDMTIGALLNAGGDFTHLEKELRKLHIEEEYKLKIANTIKNGITATKFDVILTSDEANQDHGGHSHHEHDKHDHSDENHHHHHHHGHTHPIHDHEHHEHHHHHHRTYKDIVKLITDSELSEKVKEMSLRIFRKIGEAEGKIHGLSLEKVHFHEVGAVDSIIDIVGTAILIEQLEIEKIKSAPVPTGSGHIHIAHGIYPIPAPATLEILTGVPLAQSELKAELTTPTGAAFAAVLAEEYSVFPAMKVEKIGYGAGTKSFPNHPNVLRVVIGEQ